MKFDFTKMRKGLKRLCSCGSGRQAVPDVEKFDDVTVDDVDGACKGCKGMAASKVKVSDEAECRAKGYCKLVHADLRRE